jgi:peptide/nickel transport system substrate-binding protein
VRAYDWNNSDILDWFFSGNGLGYPNVSMWEDEEGQRLNDVAMTESATSAERIANFTAYHEYVLSSTCSCRSTSRPRTSRSTRRRSACPTRCVGTRFRSQSFMDIQVVE